MSKHLLKVIFLIDGFTLSQNAFAVFNGDKEADLAYAKKHRYAALMYFNRVPDGAFIGSCGATLV
ncbi:MAG: hypothetical protein ACK5Z5_09955, partial [Neisseriaceae bacterium]